MDYDIDSLWRVLVAAVERDGPIGDRMDLVIGECERQKPHPDWPRIRELNFDAELNRLESWVRQAVRGGVIGPTSRGLWFGLFNPIRKDAPSADEYVGASPSFSFDNFDWAEDVSPPFEYLQSHVLACVYDIAYGYDGALENDAEYPVALAYGAMAASAALTAVGTFQPFVSLQGAAVGFDNGDFMFIGRFAHSRFLKEVTAG